jgi:hypothetical protein
MIISTQLEAIDRDIALIVSEELSPQAQNKALIEFAREQIDLAVEEDKSALGRVPSYVTFINGAIGAPEQFRLNSVLTVEFDLVEDVLTWIAEELRRTSPVRTGRYQASHKLYADGREVDPEHVPAASEYVFINELPYAHKIETGESQLAPKGVYELVAGKAAQRFGNMARIRFSYRAPFAGGLVGGRFGNRVENRRPAIIITLR